MSPTARAAQIQQGFPDLQVRNGLRIAASADYRQLGHFSVVFPNRTADFI
jgi:hypothetical protein